MMVKSITIERTEIPGSRLRLSVHSDTIQSVQDPNSRGTVSTHSLQSTS